MLRAIMVEQHARPRHGGRSVHAQMLDRADALPWCAGTDVSQHRLTVEYLWHRTAVLLRRRGWYMAGTARHQGSRLDYLQRGTDRVM
jgi:hypothetical protein